MTRHRLTRTDIAIGLLSLLVICAAVAAASLHKLAVAQQTSQEEP